MNINKQRGFSAIELMGALLIFTSIIIAAVYFMGKMTLKRKHIENAEKVQNIILSSLNYVSDNYRQINRVTNGENIINSSLFESYISNSGKKIEMCIFTSDATKKNQQLYLIINDSKVSLTDLSQLSNELGSHSYTLTQENSNYRLTGLNKNDELIKNSTIAKLNSGCKFNKTINNTSLFIDLTRYNDSLNQLKGKTDSDNTSDINNPALKTNKNQIAAKSNLILDNIVREAYSYQTKYCDVSNLPVSDAALICQQNLAQNTGMYSGTAKWVSSTLSSDGQSCIAVAKAEFYQTNVQYTCNGVALPPAQNYCSNTSGWVQNSKYGYNISNSPKYLIQGTAIWNPNPPALQGNTCVSQAYARYQYPYCEFGIYDNRCTYMSDHRMLCPFDAFQCPTGKDSSDVNATVTNYIAVLGHYDINSAKCLTDYSCRNSKNQLKATHVAFPITPRYIQDQGYTACNTVSVAATTNYYNTSIGELNCSVTKTYGSSDKTNVVKEEHRYRAIDFGVSGQNAARVLVKSSANSGFASSIDELKVVTAGMNAGLLTPEETTISIGSPCNSQDVGKTIKQKITTSTLSGGQLQCMYNPTLCQTNGYCYLTQKDTSYTINLQPVRSSYSCPSGTFVSNDQPIDGIVVGFVCPTLSGYSNTRAVYGRFLDPYSSIFDASQIYKTYETTCDYRNNTTGQTTVVAVNALAKITCSTQNKTYEIQNYKSQ